MFNTSAFLSSRGVRRGLKSPIFVRLTLGAMVAAALAVSFVAPLRAEPPPWIPGDVFVGTGDILFGVPSHVGTYLVYNDDGTIKETLPSDAGQAITAGCAVNPEPNPLTPDPATRGLWTTGFYTGKISHFDPTTHQLVSHFDPFTNQMQPYIDVRPRIKDDTYCNDDPEFGCGLINSIVFDKAGNFYVGSAEGLGADNGKSQVLMYDATGEFVRAYMVPTGWRGTYHLDLAADQKTMFFTSEDQWIRLFNVEVDGNGNQLPLPQEYFDAGVQHMTDPDLDPTGSLNLFGKIDAGQVVAVEGEPYSGVFGLRLLPPGDGITGGLLVGTDAGLYRIDIQGNEQFAYNGNKFFPLDITPDGSAFWTATLNYDGNTPSYLYKYHIATGTPMITPFRGDWDSIPGVCVMDEYTAAVVQPSPEECDSNPGNPLCSPVPVCAPNDPRSECAVPGSPTFINQITTRTDTEHDAVDFTVSANSGDPLHPAVTYSVNQLPPGWSGDPIVFDTATGRFHGTLGWDAAERSGVQGLTIHVTATNYRGQSATWTFTWHVDNLNAPPEIFVSPAVIDGNRTATVSSSAGVAITDQMLSATDPDPLDWVYFRLQNGSAPLPPGLQLESPQTAMRSNRIFGTPTTAGFYTFTLLGTDNIDRTGGGSPDHTPASQLITFNWTVQPLNIVLTPGSALNLTGTSHTVTATLTAAGGGPVDAGLVVSFTVLSGPNAGVTGTGTTNGSGVATFTYNDGAIPGGRGTDTIRASYSGNNSNVVTKVWADCGQATASQTSLAFPLDNSMRPVSITNLPTPVTITAICQDENPNFELAPAYAIDGAINGANSAQVRAQRSGTRTAPGNGRVYRLYFNAPALSCSGSVTVSANLTANGVPAAVEDATPWQSTTGAPGCIVP